MTISPKHPNDSHETRIALLEQSIGHVSQILLRIEARMDRIESRIDKIDLRMDKIESRLWNLTFIMITFSAALLTTMAKGFHWI
jgi:hypothetical protein